jgi:hypothetical protein
MARAKPELRPCRVAFGFCAVGPSELVGSSARSTGSLTTRATLGPRFGIRVGAENSTFVIGAMTFLRAPTRADVICVAESTLKGRTWVATRCQSL